MSARVTFSLNRRMAGAVALVFAITSVFSLATPMPAAAWDGGPSAPPSESDLVSAHQPEPRGGRPQGAQGRLDAALDRALAQQGHDQARLLQPHIPGYGKRLRQAPTRRLLLQRRRREHRLEQLPATTTATATIHNMFMGSAGHRANILGKAWDVIGIGAYKGADGKKMWTVLFADKCGSTTSATKPKPKPNRKPKPKPTQADRRGDAEARRRSRRPSRPREPTPHGVARRLAGPARAVTDRRRRQLRRRTAADARADDATRAEPTDTAERGRRRRATACASIDAAPPAGPARDDRRRRDRVLPRVHRPRGRPPADSRSERSAADTLARHGGRSSRRATSPSPTRSARRRSRRCAGSRSRSAPASSSR